MVQDLVSFYQQEYQFRSFYSILTSRLSRLGCGQEEFTTSDRFLSGICRAEPTCNLPFALPLPPYTRIDVPVWFGNAVECTFKILVFGSEPRDTNKKFNIEATANRVFGAAFGADRWNPKTTITGKPQMKYFRVFERLITDPKVFIVFSDIVKTFEVNGDDKAFNDRQARRNFEKSAGSSNNKRILQVEINLVAPHKILLLGNDTFGFMENHSELANGWPFVRIRHPSQGGESEAKNQIEKIAREIPD